MFEGAELSTAQLAEVVGALARLDTSVDDAERIDQIRLLEELKSAAAAAQARVTTAFVTSQEAAQRHAGVPAKDVGKGVVAQVALAKRESPARTRRYVGWSRVLTNELPRTFTALSEGRISEWRAQIVARETAWLSREHRETIDEELAPHLEGWGDRRIESETKKRAYRLDPHGYLARCRRAEQDRTVTLRPAPDTMTYLTGLLPVAQGVAVLASLKRHADSARAQGDERSRGQIMADTLVERVTGQSSAAAVPVEVNLVMTDQALLNTGDARDEPARLEGHGTIPAELARRLLLKGEEAAAAWVRRLYLQGGQLVAMDSRRREFDGGLRKLLVLRDELCRTPWCDAPVRHGDHVVPVEEGGATSADNGQGLCEACNYAKQGWGWRARASGGAGREVITTTPTGHRYRSRPPEPPRTRRLVRGDVQLRQLLVEVA
ncbi:HNH endonuclease [Nocardioides caldifontis]|uniref:HNH endonuclease n=1 Tax=Nocardioides caldifontis TaxID=2588938 RepID=UPI0011DF54CE|nr:HNH endonuclease signature motif containing protein [Nocardioides caldifontis]